VQLLKHSATAPIADLPRDRQRWVALLGREDEPTDALEDYCKLLAQSLHKRGYSLEIFRVPWAEQGWRRALKDAAKRFADRRGGWVLVQYTPLAWSRRGFPLRFARVIDGLKGAGIHVLIVFHDPEPFGGRRFRDRLRRRVQLAVMRRAAQLADRIVSTISPDRVAWMQDPAIRAKTLLLPVGSNLPVMPRKAPVSGKRIPVVIVFGFSNLASETSMIARVLLRAAEEVGPLHLTVFGRGAKVAGTLLLPLLAKSPVELEDFGILEAEGAGSLLANADVQLFVRSGLSSRRGSGIAGIACGLPIVGFSDAETTFPITEAGVRLVPMGDQEGLVRELVVVLKEQTLRETLRQRSFEATERYFSWDRIADAYLSFLRMS
jgi:glycosyltransferase involved in cell wall biosynthesis